MVSSGFMPALPPGSLPVRHQLNAQGWEAAAVIAGLRLAVTDKFRAPNRDQGASGNVRNEIMGVMAELVGRSVLGRHVADSEGVSGCLLSLDGPDNDVDLAFRDRRNTVHRVELKGHLRQDGYYFFAINKVAHEKCAARGSTGYVGVLTTLGGFDAVVSNIVPTEDVRDWNVKNLNRKRNDLAFVLPLIAFRRMYTDGMDPDLNAPPCIESARLSHIISLARTKLHEVASGPELSDKATAKQAKEWALVHLQRWS